MANPRLKIVGVLGGMGPEATLNFYAKLIEKAKAERDQDHVPTIINSFPQVPDRNAAIAGKGPSPRTILAAMAKSVERGGAGFLVMACNAGHAYADAIRETVKIPFVSIVDEVCDEVLRRDPGIKKVGILAATGTLDSKIYDKAFSRRNLEMVTLDFKDRATFQELLYKIKAGDHGDDVKAGMKALAELIVQQGAEVIITACSEIPLVLSAEDISKPSFDSIEILAERCVLYARDQANLPKGS